MARSFSLFRLGAMIRKEFIQMRRDRLTFAMMLGVPVMQLVLFGYAINSDPKHLPTALFAQDHSVFTRSIVKGMENSDYFDIVARPETAAEANELIRTGKVQFVLQIPPDFSRELQRGQRPELLLDADATDPAATGNRSRNHQGSCGARPHRDLEGPLATLRPRAEPVNLIVHRRYNAEGRTELNIVPGLIGVILTMTMIIFTALAMTREAERGTMENLLTMPVRPFEVMMGKILPYIIVGYIQAAVVLAAACWLSFFRALLLRRREPCRRLHLLDPGAEPVAGRTDDDLLFPAVDPAFRIHVSVSRHAGLGAVARRGSSAYALPQNRARHPAQGERNGGDRAGPSRPPRLPDGGLHRLLEPLSPDARLR